MSTEPIAEAELRRRVYGFARLSRYPFRRRAVIRVAGVVFYWVIALIGRTVRWTVIGWEHQEALERAGRHGVFTFWHNRVILATWFWRRRGIVVMTSQSYDGEYIARFIQRFGYGASRGSSHRGGLEATQEMRACLEHGMDVGFTIDGPRGPVYVAKRGAVQLAAMTGQPIVPFGASAERFWEVKSWDRFQIPRPFSRAVLIIGEPMFVPQGATADTLAQAQAALQATLDELRERGDRWWGASTARPGPTTARRAPSSPPPPS